MKTISNFTNNLSSHFLLYLFLISVTFYSCKEEKLDVDILITNGIVYDGIDATSKQVSIGIKEDKIVFIGNEQSITINATKTIDAKGLVISPGFIDPHTHADRDLIDPENSHNQPFLFQGVTTIVIGNDGSSYYPSSKYIELYKNQGIGTNAVLLLGHGTIRRQIIGSTDQKASNDDIKKMQDLVQKEMDAGAFGMSTGLFYAPGSYSNTDEVIALSKIVAQNNGIYDSHIRDESSYNIGLISAIEEAIEIGRQAHLPIHISHIKCLGVDVWQQSAEIIKLIDNAREEGIDVTADQYPYDASSTTLKAATVPRWAESGGQDSLFIRFMNSKLKKQILEETKSNIVRRGGPEKLLIVGAEDSLLIGKTLLDISNELKITPEETVFKLIISNHIKVASFNMNSEDISNFMKQDWVVTGSDGNSGHPRKYGSFPRKYNTYVKQEKVIDLATFINNSSSKTAEILRIPNRGILNVGYYADIIIFNPNTFKDVADYNDAFQYSEGLEYSIINGQLVIEQGKFTGNLNGKVLTK